MKLMGTESWQGSLGSRFEAEQASQRPTSSRHELNLQVAAQPSPAQPSSAQRAQRAQPRPRPTLAL